jgi:predicted RNA binding protein YcfA (HicA-like mRNA interferase family)
MKNNFMQSIKTTKEAVKFLSELGYTEKSKRGGSHRIFICSNRPVISLPDHNSGKSILSDGVKRNILKLALGESYYGK